MSVHLAASTSGSRRPRGRAGGGRLLALLLALPALAAAQSAPTFTADVAPILAAKCIGCHHGSVKMGGLDLDTAEAIEKGGSLGKVVVPGDSASSRLYLMVAGKAQPPMPLSGEPLSAEEIETIRRWIDAGASGPRPGEPASVSALKSEQADRRKAALRPKGDRKPQIFSLAFSPDGQLLALGGYQEVRLIEAATSKPVATLTGLREVARSLSFSPDGSLLAAGGGLPGRKGEVSLFDVKARTLLRGFEGHDDTIQAVAFSPDGKLIATSSYDKLIKLWDIATGKEIRTLKDHIDAIYALAFTPDGRRLVSGAADRSVKIWDPATGERLYTLSDPLDGITSLAVSPKGDRVAAGGYDRTVRVWRLGEKGGELAASLIAHEAPILRVAWSPDGRILATASADATIKLFEAETLAELGVIANQPDWVMSLEFAPDGKTFAAGRFDGSLTVYRTAEQTRQGSLATSPGAAPSQGAHFASPKNPAPRGGVSSQLAGPAILPALVLRFAPQPPSSGARRLPQRPPDPRTSSTKWRQG
jgi:dipeptidyl aminopeptidase/acylaminoacyl peptidase